jgi:hypothetical protein
MAAALAGAVMMTGASAYAGDTDTQALRAELQAMKQAYETKIDQLEHRIAGMEQAKTAQTVASTEPAAGSVVPATTSRPAGDNSFNPAIGVILNGHYSAYSEDDSGMAGFALGEEAERAAEGLSVDETEVNFSASVDDKFSANATIALHDHDGETEIEAEEAYFQTTGLPAGLGVKAGRFFVPLGYLNEQHAHADDFADRPLLSRAFLGRQYGDDGVEVSWVLPTDLYSEIGAGGFRGRGWRLGLSTLQAHGVDRAGNEDTVFFSGDSNLYGIDGRLVWAPDGNNHEQEVILQGEYFLRDEDGTYDDTDAGTGAVAYDDTQSGWYAQGVYKFDPQWRVGVRYSALSSPDVPAGLAGSALDDEGHNPWAASGMVDWSNSEFSRVRFQYNREELAENQDDNQFLLQYVMSIGAHGAHPF